MKKGGGNIKANMYIKKRKREQETRSSEWNYEEKKKQRGEDEWGRVSGAGGSWSTLFKGADIKTEEPSTRESPSCP